MPDIRSLYEKDFLGQWDVADQEMILTIAGVTQEEVADPTTHKKKKKVCLTFKETDKKMVLNATNREIIAKALLKTCDDTKWNGHQIQLYKDPKVRFGRDEVGGLRIRKFVPNAGAPIYCEECGQQIQSANGMTPEQIAAYTQKNYYTQEANQAYWSASLVKEFQSCEARALATLNGEYVRESTQALLVGSYVDAFIEGPGAFQKFCSEHPEIFKRDGSLKAEYTRADAMLARMNASPVFMEYLTGERQTIKTGEIFGLPFKAKFDVYVPGKRIVDLKTVKDLETVYVPGEGRMAYYDAWNWPLQLAIYRPSKATACPAIWRSSPRRTRRRWI